MDALATGLGSSVPAGHRSDDPLLFSPTREDSKTDLTETGGPQIGEAQNLELTNNGQNQKIKINKNKKQCPPGPPQADAEQPRARGISLPESDPPSLRAELQGTDEYEANEEGRQEDGMLEVGAGSATDGRCLAPVELDPVLLPFTDVVTSTPEPLAASRCVPLQGENNAVPRSDEGRQDGDTRFVTISNGAELPRKRARHSPPGTAHVDSDPLVMPTDAAHDDEVEVLTTGTQDQPLISVAIPEPVRKIAEKKTKATKGSRPRRYQLPYSVKEWKDIVRSWLTCPDSDTDSEQQPAVASSPGDILFGACKSMNPSECKEGWKYFFGETRTAGYVVVASDGVLCEHPFPSEGYVFAQVGRARRKGQSLDDDDDVSIVPLSVFEREEKIAPPVVVYPADDEASPTLEEGDGALPAETNIAEELLALGESLYTPPTPPQRTHPCNPPIHEGTQRIVFTATEIGEDGVAAAVVVEEAWGSGWKRIFEGSKLLVTERSNIAEHTAILAALKYVTANTIVGTTAICSSEKLALAQIRQEASSEGKHLSALVWRSIALANNLGLRIALHQVDATSNPALAVARLTNSVGKGLGNLDCLLTTEGETPHPTRKKVGVKTKSQTNNKHSLVPRELNAVEMSDATTPLTPESAFCNIPTFWKLEGRDVPLLASSLLSVIGRYADASSSEKTEIWRSFLLFPQRRLPRVGPKRERFARMRALLKGRIPTPWTEDKQEVQTFTERKLRAATALAKQQLLGKAARTLERKETVLPQDLQERAEKLHPQGKPITLPASADDAYITVCPKVLSEILRQSASGKSPGPSGWSEDLLLQAATHSEEVLAALTCMIRDVLNFSISGEVRDVLASSRFVPVWDPDANKLRPIAIGETVVKLAESYAIRSRSVNEYIGRLVPLQYAFAPSGAETIVHSIRDDLAAGKTVVSLDGVNAFNAIHRQRIFDAILAEKDLVPLRPLSRLMYSTPSHLLSPTLRQPVLSTEGTKQGSVLGPLLFSAAVHPILVQLAERFPSVTFRAFMDDICVTGKEFVDEAISDLVSNLAHIGIITNPNKSWVIGNDQLAAKLGFAACSGNKLLGAWVGRADDAKAFCVKRIEPCTEFFSAVRLLPAEFGVPILTKCGVPRMGYIVRTHDPEASKDACVHFEAELSKSLCSLAGIRGPLSLEQRFCAHLPPRMGGLGVTNFNLIASQAYQASKNSEVQKVLVEEKNKTLVESLDGAWKTHLARVRKSDQTWLNLCVENAQYHRALQLRLRACSVVAATHTSLRCKSCGCNCASEEALANHILGCARLEGMNVATRHNAIRDVVVGFCRTNGIPASTEPSVGVKNNTHLRADARIILPEEDVYVDFTICNSESKTHSDKSWSKIQGEKKSTKGQLYADMIAPLGAFVVFSVETFGRLGNDAISLVKRLEVTAGKPNVLTQVITSTLWKMNAGIVANYARRW